MNKEILIHEFDSLMNTLDHIQEEQSIVKRKLSILLESAVLLDFLVWSEELLQQILNRETAVLLLRKDINAFKKSVLTKKTVAIYVDLTQHKFFKKFKDQVHYLENEFSDWKLEADEKLEEAKMNPTKVI
ncbi:MAG: hypothetical protein D4R94_05780 [Chitinophagaceae bacterium]|nr:MAG: hypothetical protein D4R94_05780 [Chitinophagaceae bacterium]